MATYAILGATGNTGSALIQNLLKTPSCKINAYCRNKKKLLNKLPEVVENKRVQIFEGSIDDVDLHVSCLRGCKAVFLVITSNDNIPGFRGGQDSAQSVISALQKIRGESGPETPLPKIVLLSSATIDDKLAHKMPKWFRPVMLTAASHIYDDLRVAERLLRAQQDWVKTIFIKPGGLAVDKQRGDKLTLVEEESFISFLDLAAAMIEAADDQDGYYDMKNVSVNNTGGSAAFPKGTPLTIVFGLMRHYFHWTHKYLPSIGPG